MGYSSASSRIAYTKHGLFIRIGMKSIHANMG